MRMGIFRPGVADQGLTVRRKPSDREQETHRQQRDAINRWPLRKQSAVETDHRPEQGDGRRQIGRPEENPSHHDSKKGQALSQTGPNAPGNALS